MTTALSILRPVDFKFSPGKVVATQNALRNLTHREMLAALERHVLGDWGEVGENDKAANDAALIEGTRLLSVYSSGSGTKFWIITEADRSATTILLPEDY